jgi:FkbM family methyltransferase
MGSCIYWYGWHHRQELKFLENNVRSHDVVVDVGANTGEFTVALAPYATQVLCFEPQSDVLAVLRDNVELNGFKNVTIFPFGLSDSEETAQLYGSSEKTQFGGLNEGLYTRYLTCERSVASGISRFRPLDTVLVETGIKHIDWLKIDVEGAEMSVLKGARETLKRSRPTILIELNEEMCQSAGYSVQDIHQYLTDLEYRGYYLTRTNRLAALRENSLGKSFLNAIYRSS